MEEIWKDIEGYEGLYQISNLGRVKSLERTITVGLRRKVRKKEKIMKFTIRSGYYNLVLRKNGKRKSKQVHRLVADAFIPKVEGKNIVNHINFNRKDNRAENLEWCTQAENVKHSIYNMKKRKKTTYSNTNEKYISYRKTNKTYRITIDRKEYKSKKTLEEAIKERDRILNEINNSKKKNMLYM